MLGQDDCPPYVINTYIYNGTLGEAMWAVANTVGCYANAFELAPEEFNERLVYLQEHMRDEDFETYLQNEYI